MEYTYKDIEEKLLEYESKKKQLIKELKKIYPFMAKDLSKKYATEEVNKDYLYIHSVIEIPDMAMEYSKDLGSLESFLEEATKRAMEDILYWKSHPEHLRAMADVYGEAFEGLSDLEKSAYLSEEDDFLSTFIWRKAMKNYLYLKKRFENEKR